MPLALATSAVLHVLLMLLLLHIQRAAVPADEAKAPPRKIDYVNLPPLPRHLSRIPKAAPRTITPPTPTPPLLAHRDTRAPSSVTRNPETAPGHAATPTMTERAPEAAPPTPPPQPAQPKQSPPAASTPSTVASAAPASALETEARRLFGPHDPGDTATGGPKRSQSLVSVGAEGSSSSESDCRPVQHPPRDPSAPPELVTIIGHILRRDNRRPLAGAHLQMIGTPYSTFTDDTGRYEFRFSKELVEDCRTQLVRVEAPGYQTEWVYVVVSPGVPNDDLMLQQRHGRL
ncbi:MAG: carboxypeptidase-like regulatory domain-containing protein [Gemmatimonadota bacterium]